MPENGKRVLDRNVMSITSITLFVTDEKNSRSLLTIPNLKYQTKILKWRHETAVIIKWRNHLTMYLKSP